jgi:ribosomal protein S18 acetylase RimI-like enzyme
MFTRRVASSGVRAGSGRIAAISDLLFEIRPCQPDDLEAVYRICLATGDNGGDAAHLYDDAKLIGHIYAAPYVIFSSQCGFVVEDEAGVGGYVLGALDTGAFERQLEEKWWPRLRPLYADPTGKPPKEWSLEETRRWQIHHPRPTPAGIAGPYPSHLHIDLLPRLQGQGIGPRLIERWLATVRGLGSRGAHLGVGAGNGRAVAFYRAGGWRQLASSSSRTLWFARSFERD